MLHHYVHLLLSQVSRVISLSFLPSPILANECCCFSEVYLVFATRLVEERDDICLWWIADICDGCCRFLLCFRAAKKPIYMCVERWRARVYIVWVGVVTLPPSVFNHTPTTVITDVLLTYLPIYNLIWCYYNYCIFRCVYYSIFMLSGHCFNPPSRLENVKETGTRCAAYPIFFDRFKEKSKTGCFYIHKWQLIIIPWTCVHVFFFSLESPYICFHSSLVSLCWVYVFPYLVFGNYSNKYDEHLFDFLLLQTLPALWAQIDLLSRVCPV